MYVRFPRKRKLFMNVTSARTQSLISVGVDFETLQQNWEKKYWTKQVCKKTGVDDVLTLSEKYWRV